MEEKDAEEGKGFKVVDKRRFTSEGDTRPDAPPEPPSRPAEEAGPARPQPPPEEVGPGERRMDFITFVASLATNALGAMGALPEERSHGIPVSPDLAREYIDILAMLQEKTRGNLTGQEDQMLQRLLSDLRLQFVELTGKGKKR